MADRKIRRVEDVFGGGMDNKQQNILERKTSFNVFKNKKAPQPPPPGQNALPKIGNYQPKILLQSAKQEEDTMPKRSRRDSSGQDNFRNSFSEQSASRYSDKRKSPVRNEKFVIGDKDIPLRIENIVDDMDDTPIPAPRRKRRAPDVPPEPEIGTNNPLFGRSMSQRSDKEILDLGFEEQGGDIDFGPGIDNPGFNSRDRKESSSSYRSDIFQSIPENAPTDKPLNYPYIPPPDYEDEELTMNFDDENDQFVDQNRNSTVFKEFEGEDYGKYLNEEEDYEFDIPQNKYQKRAAPRAPPRNGPFQSGKQSPKKEQKPKKKHKQKDVTSRSTIRDFAYSDSKIGWGDRTVKSTSAKGRYIKREKDRRRVGNGNSDTFEQNGRAGPGSYEDFLRAKNGMTPESPNSSDSGVDIMEENGVMRDMYLNSQPKQMRDANYDHKPSMWQRLTWRFKKSVNITRQSERL